MYISFFPFRSAGRQWRLSCCNYQGQPKAGTGHKMLSVSFVFSMSRFQGPAFRCDKIVVIVTLFEAIEGIPDEDCNFLGNEKFQETSS